MAERPGEIHGGRRRNRCGVKENREEGIGKKGGGRNLKRSEKKKNAWTGARFWGKVEGNLSSDGLKRKAAVAKEKVFLNTKRKTQRRDRTASTWIRSVTKNMKRRGNNTDLMGGGRVESVENVQKIDKSRAFPSIMEGGNEKPP